MPPREKPSRGNIGLLIATLAAGILIIGAGYEQVERWRDRELVPQIGRSVDIGGRALNLYCSGSGSPPVIFESSTPRSGYSWVAIQREVARFTQACWYDRAGLGWSDLGPYPRDSRATTQDLHALLEAAKIAPPYVLAAETLATLDARVYARLYPAEVEGVVFVDGIHPDLFSRIPQMRGRAAPIQKYIGYPQNALSQVLNQLGVLRLMFANRSVPGPPPPKLSAAEWGLIWRLTWRPSARTALMQELSSVEESTEQARVAGTLGDRPLVVLNAENQRGTPVERQTSQELQADLARLSSRGKLVTLKQSGDFLEFQAPDEVTAAVRDVVAQLHREGRRH